MAPLADSIAAESLVLWNVVETHFDELEFAVEQFERRLEDPMLPLSELARYPQPMLDAHADGLAVGGDEVREQLLLPQLRDAGQDDAQRARTTAAALGVIAANRFDVLWTVIAQTPAPVRAAVARAASISARPELDRWVVDKLSRTQTREALLGLVELAAARRCATPNVLQFIESDDAQVVATGLRAALYGDAQSYRAIAVRRLNHPDPQVRQAAMIATLTWGLREGWDSCEQAALKSGDRFAMALYAALGGRKHHARLTELLARAELRVPVLFALGFSGNAEMLSVLTPVLRSSNPLEVKLAAQSISLIAGLDLSSEHYLAPRAEAPEPGTLPPPEEDAEALASLPPLEHDDLDADLVPQPEDAIPELNIHAIERACRTASLDPTRRLLAGAAYGGDLLIDYFERAPLRRRHLLALALGITTSGAVWFDTRAGAREQQMQLAALRARGIASLMPAYKAW